MNARALARQGYTYAEIGRLLGRDWRTVKRYLETSAQPVYRRKRMPSKLDEFKPLIDQWLAATPGLLATRIHQDLVRDDGFEGSYNTVRRYIERSRPRPTPRQQERFETRPGHQAQVDWSRAADQDQLRPGAAAVLLICVGAPRQGAGCRPSANGGVGFGRSAARSRVWVWCARAPGLISVRDPAVQPVGDVMVDGVIPLG